MDERFVQVYDTLFAEFLARARVRDESGQRGGVALGGIESSYSAFIASTIVTSAQELGIDRRLRSDARYFLLINFTDMIAEPVVRDPERATSGLTLREDIGQDIRAVLSMAAGRTFQHAPREKATSDVSILREITGGDVLKSVATLYDSLRVARIRIWN